MPSYEFIASRIKYNTDKIEDSLNSIVITEQNNLAIATITVCFENLLDWINEALPVEHRIDFKTSQAGNE